MKRFKKSLLFGALIFVGLLLVYSAVFVQVNKTDSMFLHADTLCSYNDTTIVNDEPKIFRMILAYHKAKIYKEASQIDCLISECNELISIFVKSINTASKSKPTSEPLCR